MHSQSPVQEYSCLSDVISETKDLYVIDLVKSTLRLPERYLELLEPEPVGIYIRGALEPFIRFDTHPQGFFTATQFKKDRSRADIWTPEQFLLATEIIVDAAGRYVCSPPMLHRNQFQDHCSFHYSAVHIAAVTVWNILRSLHRDTTPSSPMPGWMLDESRWVKTDRLAEFYGISSPDIGELTDQVLSFVGRDYFSTYTMEMQNTMLRIGKGNDFRVISYYRNIFEKHEADRFETLGY